MRRTVHLAGVDRGKKPKNPWKNHSPIAIRCVSGQVASGQLRWETGDSVTLVNVQQSEALGSGSGKSVWVSLWWGGALAYKEAVRSVGVRAGTRETFLACEQQATRIFICDRSYIYKSSQ